MSQCYIHANLFEICQPVYTSTFWLKFGSLSPTVTMKIRSRSPKPNQLFIMSQCYIHANLVKIHPPVHEISCKQESVTLTPMPTLTPTPTGSAPTTICPPHLASALEYIVTTVILSFQDRQSTRNTQSTCTYM